MHYQALGISANLHSLVVNLVSRYIFCHIAFYHVGGAEVALFMTDSEKSPPALSAHCLAAESSRFLGFRKSSVRVLKAAYMQGRLVSIICNLTPGPRPRL